MLKLAANLSFNMTLSQKYTCSMKRINKRLFFIGMLIEIQMQTSHKMQLGAYMLLGLGAFE
jgi:hypothetical protein